MAISFIGAASAEATTVTIPAHQAGDLLLMFVFRAANGVATVPAGWTIRRGSTHTNFGRQECWKWATSSSETSGTWTNATVLMCAVYRSDTNYLYVGGTARNQNSAGTTTINYPALSTNTTNNSDAKMYSGSAWVVGYAFSATSNASTMDQAPSGMTQRHNNATFSSYEAVLHDTNGAVASWASTSITADVSIQYASCTLELIEGPALSGGSGASGFPLGRLAV